MSRISPELQEKLDAHARKILSEFPTRKFGVEPCDFKHPDTKFIRKRCPVCGKFYRTDMDAETCVDCSYEDYSRFDCGG